MLYTLEICAIVMASSMREAILPFRCKSYYFSTIIGHTTRYLTHLLRKRKRRKHYHPMEMYYCISAGPAIRRHTSATEILMPKTHKYETKEPKKEKKRTQMPSGHSFFFRGSQNGVYNADRGDNVYIEWDVKSTEGDQKTVGNH